MVSTALSGDIYVVLSILDNYDCFEKGFLGCLDSFESVDNFLSGDGWGVGQF